MTPELAAEKLIKLARKIAWSPHSGLQGSTRVALQQAVRDYEAAKKRPTAFDHVMADDDIYDHEPNVPRCAYAPCSAPMMSFRHSRRKYHTEECRKKAFIDRKKGLKK